MRTRFSSKRGRPKINRPTIDKGTPELVKKREQLETAEAIDLCFERAIITQSEHWCGIHLRWLHTLRYGAPTIQAIDMDLVHHDSSKQADASWNEERESEYKTAISLLYERRLLSPLINICIYNESPDFIRRKVALSNNSMLLLERFRMGLQQLEKLWGR